MYNDFSPTNPASMAFISAVARQATLSQDRNKATAMGIGLAIARSFKLVSLEGRAAVEVYYKENCEVQTFNFVATLSELTPFDTVLARRYAFQFYCLGAGVQERKLDAADFASTSSFIHGLLGTHHFFSQIDLAFMEEAKASICPIALAASNLLVAEQ